MAKCNCCGQEIRKAAKPRASKSPAKWLAEDTAKAEAAIDALGETITRNWNALTPIGYGHNTVITGAVERPEFLERATGMTRLRRALTEPELLWSIYRRKSPRRARL